MPAPPRPDAAVVRRLRTDLAGAGWTVDAVTETIGEVAAAALARDDPAPARRALAAPDRAGTPVAVLTTAFVLSQQVTRAELDAALPLTGADGAERLGLVAAAGLSPFDGVRALVDLRPHAATSDLPSESGHWWVASDLGESATRGPLGTDHVLGVGGASTTLAALVPRAPVSRLLDLGTGSGVQVLHAAAHAGELVATDTSPRALAFAAFNLELAGVRADLRRGSLLEPVAGERFDQVVSNPPFVITPRSARVPEWQYRDGGLVGDDVVRRLVVGLGEHLAPGGSAQLLGNWEHRRGEGWRERVEGWIAESGLDGWVVQREVTDPAEYAETWIRDGGQRQGPAFEALVGEWLDDFAARGVEAVGFGFVVLHAPPAVAASRPRWRRAEELTGPLHPGLGAHVARVLATRDQLAATDDAALLARRLVAAADLTEERHSRPGAGGPQLILLRQGGGLGRVVAVDTPLAAVVGACDGEVPLGHLVTAVAGLLDLDGPALTTDLLPRIRELAADQLLVGA